MEPKPPQFSERAAFTEPALTLLASTLGATPDGKATYFGAHGYSYNVVARRFAPLLERLGQVVWLDRPESRIEYAIRQARRQNQAPLAISFRPFQSHFPARTALNVIYPFWEFPDLPDEPIDSDLRWEWGRMSRTVQLILTATQFTAETFARAGVPTPVRVVPPPAPEECFALPFWEGPHLRRLPTPSRTLQQKSSAAPTLALPPDLLLKLQRQAMPQGMGTAVPRSAARGFAAQAWRSYVAKLSPMVPDSLNVSLHRIAGKITSWWKPARPMPLAPESETQLSGVVYTMVLQPGPRKSWQELISAFICALRECADATLVLRVVTRKEERPLALDQIKLSYERLAGVSHRCRILLLPHEMSEELMLRLTEATTYYVNATRAEGACLPVQEMMAAGRPALSPVHSAMKDYFDAEVGFVIESRPERCCFPGDPSRRLKTSWELLSWQSLHDQFRASYALAKRPADYAALAARARERMHQWASPERVFSLLREALAPLAVAAREPLREAAWLSAAPAEIVLGGRAA